MKHSTKTKLAWLAVALMLPLVAVGCSATAQDPPPVNPTAPLPTKTEPATIPELIEPPADFACPSTPEELYGLYLMYEMNMPKYDTAYRVWLTNCRHILPFIPYEPVETKTPTAQLTTDATARLTIDPVIIDALAQQDGATHTFDMGICEQIDFEVPISTATRVIGIYCFDLSDGGFQLTSQIEELQPPDEGGGAPQNEIDGWRAICDILGVNPALYDCFEDYNGKFAANHLLPRRAHVRTDGEICFDGPILTDCD